MIKVLWRSRRSSITALIAAATMLPRPALAHFNLEAPACWMSQDILGLPQKQGPCGNEGGGTPTGVVTTYQEGQSITLTVNEIIFHPGHYRISLAMEDSADIPDGGLPAEPIVTPGATPCGTIPIMDPPVFPVLADNVFPHTAQFTTPQTTTINLPPGVTCTHCSLQVIEFMSDHPLNIPGGCFYHHCADIQIQAAPVPDGGLVQIQTDAGLEQDVNGKPVPSPDAGTPAKPKSGGCGCSFASDSSVIGLLMLGGLLRRRRRTAI